MPTKLVSDKDLLDRVREVFRTEGYQGASISRLHQATGLGRSSLYHRFPKGKSDMAIAVLNDTANHFVNVIFAEQHQEPADQLDHIISGLRAFYADGTLACLIDTLSLGEPDDMVSDLLNQTMQSWIAAFADLAIRGGQGANEAHFAAVDAIASIEGSLVMQRATGSCEAFDRALSSLPSRLVRN